MNRTLLLTGALVLALPALALAQPAHDRHRNRARRDSGPRVSVHLSFGGASRVPVRVAPSLHTPVYRHVSPGGQLVVLDRRGDYYLVEDGFGRRGWVHCSSLPGYRHHTVTTVIVREPLVTTFRSDEVASLGRFEYSRVLEWSGNHEQGRLRLTPLADGSWLAEVESESIAPRRAKVQKEALVELVAAVGRMQDFPDHSFAGDGAHFYTTVSAEGRLADGRALRLSRSFYDPSASRPARLASELDGAVQRLIQRIVEAVPASPVGVGITATFGR